MRRYGLEYDDESSTATGRSRIVQVTECGTNEISCLAPLEFTWTDEDVGALLGDDVPDQEKMIYSPIYPSDTDRGLYDPYSKIFGDFDGDGRLDIVYHTDRNDYTPTLKVTPCYGRDGDSECLDTYLTDWGASSESRVHNGLPGDFNGDGLTDILWYHSDAQGRTSDPAQPTADHRALWLGRADRSFTEDPNPGGLNFQSTMFKRAALVGDFNGDGISDVLWYRADDALRIQPGSEGQEVDVWYGSPTETPNGSYFVVQAGAYPPDQAGLAGYRATPGDFNGDGLTDILWWHAKADTEKFGWLVDGRSDEGADDALKVVWYSTAAGFVSSQLGLDVDDPSMNPNDVAAGHSVPRPADFNGDGLTDVLWYRTSSVEHHTANTEGGAKRWLWLSKGGSSGAFRVISNVDNKDGTWKDSKVAVGDINSDGLADIVLTTDNEEGPDSVLWLSRGDGSFNDAYFPSTDLLVDGSFIADFQGDGISEVELGPESTAILRVMSGELPDLMKSVTDGLGANRQRRVRCNERGNYVLQGPPAPPG